MGDINVYNVYGKCYFNECDGPTKRATSRVGGPLTPDQMSGRGERVRTMKAMDTGSMTYEKRTNVYPNYDHIYKQG